MLNRSRSWLIGLALSGAASFVTVAGPARAGTHDLATITLGSQTETADAVVVGELAGGAVAGVTEGAEETDFRVDRSLKGDVAAGATIRVRLESHGRGAPWRAGVPHLLFLRRAKTPDGAPAEFEPVAGAFSVRPLAQGSVEERFPALVAMLREALDTKEAAPLRTLLVSWMEDSDPGVAWSAATDFVRHSELSQSLTAPESARIAEAFRRQPLGKATKGALALALAATHDPSAPEVLADSLLVPGAGSIRAVVGEALRRTDASVAESILATKLEVANAEQRSAILGALSVVGSVKAAPRVGSLLSDSDATVRVEAAAALGQMARNARDKDADARLGVAGDLTARLEGESAAKLPESEFRAVLWALAQLDEPGAFDAIRSVAGATDRPEIRDWAASLLARPRQSLLPRL